MATRFRSARVGQRAVALSAAGIFGVLGAACGGERSASDEPPVVDRWQVWVCSVPSTTTSDDYREGPLGERRVPLDPEVLAATFVEHLAPWFSEVSYGSHQLKFSVGGVVTLTPSDNANECLDRALDGSDHSSVDGVIAVADAVHPVSMRGGFGRPGTPCPGGNCPAVVSRRGAYVGAADFVPGWGVVPALDLVAHEIGHALGWGHSGIGVRGEYLSAIDLMSDSAALRSLDPDLRLGPPPLAFHRWRVGWLHDADVVELDWTSTDGSQAVELWPVSAPSGHRLLLLVAGGITLTVEVLDDVLLAPVSPGVAVHRVSDEVLEPLVAAPPHVDLLQPGDTFITDGWTLRVVAPEFGSRSVPWTVVVGR